MPEPGTLQDWKIDHDIERRRPSQCVRGRHDTPAETHQTSQRYATEGPCRAGQAEVGKEGQHGSTAAQSRKGRQTGQACQPVPARAACPPES